jgi:hypothetical protein
MIFGRRRHFDAYLFTEREKPKKVQGLGLARRLFDSSQEGQDGLPVKDER